MSQSVKLAKLKLSENNARTAPPRNIEGMAASIRARGILKNILVAASKPRGSFEIIDGGRRFLGAMMLAEAGEIDAADYDVPIKIVAGDDRELREISLTANFQTEKMTAAEECRAFQNSLETEGDIDAVAHRFGETRRYIEGRLRLARLPEPIFEAFEGGAFKLEMAYAYASTEDMAKQLRVFEQYRHSAYVTPDQIRRAIINDTMKASDPIALLVGADAYVAAGGRVERELFSEDGDRWSDPEIAEALAATLMEAEAKRIGEETGLGWIRPITTTNLYGATADLHRVPLQRAPLDDEEQARADEMSSRMEAIADELADEGIEEDAAAALDLEYDRLQEEYGDLTDKAPVLPEEIKGQVGTFLTLDRGGKLVLATTYYSETPMNADGEVTAGRSGGSARDVSALPPEAIAPGGKPLSGRLHDELAVQRRDILAASLLGDAGLALDYALFAMIDRNRTYSRVGTTLTAGRPSDPAMPDDAAPTQARIAIAEAREALDTRWTEPASQVDRFEAFRALDDDSKGAWLAIIVADSLEAKPDYSSARTNPLHARLATILQIDVAKWWRPTCANFFDRVSKGTILSLLTEVGGSPLAARYLSSKKSEIATSCERLFAGEAITEADTRSAALAWVPDAMRFDVTAAGDTADADNDDDIDADVVSDDATVGDDDEHDPAAIDGSELVAAE